jgi:hypothetical protein
MLSGQKEYLQEIGKELDKVKQRCEKPTIYFVQANSKLCNKCHDCFLCLFIIFSIKVSLYFIDIF